MTRIQTQGTPPGTEPPHRLAARNESRRFKPRHTPTPSLSILRQTSLAAVLLTSMSLASSPPVNWPTEGRWSVATDWQDGWPAGWRHAHPQRIETHGEWQLYHGEINLPQGNLVLRDAERLLPGPTVIREVRRRWEWTGAQLLDTVTLSVRLQVAFDHARPILPGISYYDNPAGQAVDPSRVPVITAAQPRQRGFYEEHRYPMVFAALEGQAGDTLPVAALHSSPSPARFGHRADQWWSLGVEYLDDSTEMALYSGPVASNGRNAIVKGHQRGWHDYPDAWCTLPPGAIVEKTFFIEAAHTSRPGAGFQIPTRTAMRLLPAANPDGFPPVRDVLTRKFADTYQRWREGPEFAGLQAFPQPRRWIDLGWAGQSEAFAYPMLHFAEEFQLPAVPQHVQRGLDFISSSPFGPQGFAIRYDLDTGRWQENTNPLSQGQAMENLFHALRLAEGRTDIDTRAWQDFLRRAADFHASRLLEPDWRPVSTNEGFLIAPLARAAKVFAEPRFLAAARRAAVHYGARHLSMEEPYWGGTLDARCEDKEGAWAALQGFLVMHEITGEPHYLDWAVHAADVILTYVYLWDVPLPPGRLTDHAFKTRGWTSVSVQNMHLDVYGVLCAPALWRLGELVNRPDYQAMARLMYVSCGQLLDPLGGQGEQIHQTNYAQHYDYTDLAGVRGDYIETWNVYWISAHFLVAAAQFREMGVDVLAW